jgi:hypothetical protein
VTGKEEDMLSPALWIVLGVLFILTSLLHFAKAKSGKGGKRNARIALGTSGLFWAGSAFLFRFYTPMAAYISAGIAVALVLSASWFSFTEQREGEKS